jgi:predicted GNAT family acetyltransferase
MADEKIEVVRAAHRYEVRVDGQVAGFTMFHPDAQGRLVFPHTVVQPEFGGRGLGKVLVEQAMADVAARGETVVPLCPFVTKYLRNTVVPGLKVDWPEAGSH